MVLTSQARLLSHMTLLGISHDSLPQRESTCKDFAETEFLKRQF